MSRPPLTPLLWYQDPLKALAWLEQAFGFETSLVVEDGKGGVIHSETAYLDAILMVVGPPRGAAVSPKAAGFHSASVHVQLERGIDDHCARARAAGARIEREPETQAYGDRVYTCFDLEGHPWSFGQTVKEMSLAELAEATGHDVRQNL